MSKGSSSSQDTQKSELSKKNSSEGLTRGHLTPWGRFTRRGGARKDRLSRELQKKGEGGRSKRNFPCEQWGKSRDERRYVGRCGDAAEAEDTGSENDVPTRPGVDVGKNWKDVGDGRALKRERVWKG